MGSATREALSASRSVLDSLRGVEETTANDLFAVARVLAVNPQLRAVVADPSSESDAKNALVQRVFGDKISAQALQLLGEISSHRWSNSDEFLAGIEEIGIRAAALATPPDVALDQELLTVGAAVASDAELELALGSKLADREQKSALVDSLLGSRASTAAVSIVRQLVTQPRGRSIRTALRDSAAIVADEAGLSIATVTSAKPLDTDQVERLRTALSERYGRNLRINEVVDPGILGGLRISVGDDVIDSSIATRLADVRLQLAG